MTQTPAGSVHARARRGGAARAVLASCALAVLAALGACSGDDGGQPIMLPAASPAGAVPTGNPAGPAARGVALVESPYAFARDQAAVSEGGRLYQQMNCSDCHGYSGEGGMCPSLTDGEWLFGDTPADRFVSIHSGRARGMPAYGHMLPEESIWKIVAYVEDLGQRAADGAGRRASAGEGAQTTREAQSAGGRN